MLQTGEKRERYEIIKCQNDSSKPSVILIYTPQIVRGNAKRHPILGVLICKFCRNFYGTGNWKKDEEGCDEYCR